MCVCQLTVVVSGGSCGVLPRVDTRSPVISCVCELGETVVEGDRGRLGLREGGGGGGGGGGGKEGEGGGREGGRERGEGR